MITPADQEILSWSSLDCERKCIFNQLVQRALSIDKSFYIHDSENEHKHMEVSSA